MKTQKTRMKAQKAKMKTQKTKMKAQKAQKATVEGRTCGGRPGRRGTNLWGTTGEGLEDVVLGYCPSMGRSGVSLCGGLQGVAPRGI